MSRSLKWMSLVALLLLSGVLSTTQADEIQGGMIVEGGFGSFASLNPLFESNAVTKLLFPDFIGVDPDTGWFLKGTTNALTANWAISEDGMVYTFKLRDDWRWSDGTPITSADVLYGWEAIKSGDVDTPLGYLKDRITKVEAPDSSTLRITFASAACSALNDASALPVLPSHVLPQDFAALNTSEFNSKPGVSGRYQVSEVVPNERVVLQPNPNWAGGLAVVGYTYQFEPDQTQLLKDFTAGKLDIISNPPPDTYAKLRSNPNVNTHTYAGNTWDFLALNEADPLHPHDGGEAQGHHPLFGDVRVRQAMAKAIDVDALIKQDAAGEATRMASTIIPSSWTYNHDLKPIAYDLTEAERLLDEAGWIDDDHNPSTPRIAKGAQYAADGTPFKFTLYTNEGGTRRDAVAAGIRDQLRLVGIETDVQVIDFNALLDIIDSQKFDAYLLGWRSAYPDDPALTELFTPAGDIVGSGSNSTSYNNPEVTDLNAQAHSLVGCDAQTRAKIYGKIQAILQQDLPYIWLYSLNEMYAAQKTIKGFDPRPNQLYWNIETWSKTEP